MGLQCAERHPATDPSALSGTLYKIAIVLKKAQAETSTAFCQCDYSVFSHRSSLSVLSPSDYYLRGRGLRIELEPRKKVRAHGG